MARRVGPLAVACMTAAQVTCGSPAVSDSEPEPSVPLPTGGLIGQEVVVFPLTMLVPPAAADWITDLAPRRAALDRADSLIGAMLFERTPEVAWVLPAEVRRAAKTAPGLLPDPDRMGTAVLRRRFERLPDPLRSDLRSLTGVVGDRFALVPASLLYFDEPNGRGRAELTLVLADVRTGTVRWRSVARGEADDPWAALRIALATLAPVSP